MLRSFPTARPFQEQAAERNCGFARKGSVEQRAQFYNPGSRKLAIRGLGLEILPRWRFCLSGRFFLFATILQLLPVKLAIPPATHTYCNGTKEMAQPPVDVRTDNVKAGNGDVPAAANPLIVQIADDLPQQFKALNKSGSTPNDGSSPKGSGLPGISLYTLRNPPIWKYRLIH